MIFMSLITCPECAHTVSDKALSCPGCGYPMHLCHSFETTPAVHSAVTIPSGSPFAGITPVQKKATKRVRKKLPNGYGSIKRLSGTRSRPYAAYPAVSSLRVKDTTQPLRVPAIGYYKDWYSAFDALTEYNRAPYDIGSRAFTFAKVYELFYEDKFGKAKKNLSVSSKYAYETAFKNCSTLHDIRFFDLRKQDMQDVLDHCTLGYSSLCNLKKLFCQL